MRVIDYGINMFHLPFVDADGVQRICRLNPHWTFLIIGAVILLAVVLDLDVHMVQDKRRLRRAACAAASRASHPTPPKPEGAGAS